MPLKLNLSPIFSAKYMTGSSLPLFTITLSYLDPLSTLKLLQVSRGVRKVTLEYHFGVIFGLCREKHEEMVQHVDEKKEQLRQLNADYDSLKEQDRLRQRLVDETDEDEMRRLIQKYIINERIEK